MCPGDVGAQISDEFGFAHPAGGQRLLVQGAIEISSRVQERGEGEDFRPHLLVGHLQLELAGVLVKQRLVDQLGEDLVGEADRLGGLNIELPAKATLQASKFVGEGAPEITLGNFLVAHLGHIGF